MDGKICREFAFRHFINRIAQDNRNRCSERRVARVFLAGYGPCRLLRAKPDVRGWRAEPLHATIVSPCPGRTHRVASVGQLICLLGQQLLGRINVVVGNKEPVRTVDLLHVASVSTWLTRIVVLYMAIFRRRPARDAAGHAGLWRDRLAHSTYWR